MVFERLWRNLFPRRSAERVVGSEAQIFIDGTPHPVIDWSETGLRIATYPDSPEAGDRFAFRFVLPLTHEDVFEFEAWAEVVHNDSGGIGVRYLHLDDALTERLHAVLRVMGTTDVTIPKGALTYD